MGSFDASWNWEHGPVRIEYRVPVADEGLEKGALGSNHRRSVNRGDRAGWRLEEMAGRAGVRVINEVKWNASVRQRGSSSSFEASTRGWDPSVDESSKFSSTHGGRVFAVIDGEQLLAAALVIWSSGRAFYVEGGSTQEGYRVGAAHWMHFNIINLICNRGISVYNFGGIPTGGQDPQSPHHGLHRFKRGFGALECEVRGFRS